MNNFDIIIIGAGPAGLFAAITAASSGVRTLLLEKGKNAGRKLLIAGSGKCNITHIGNIKNFFPHYGANDKFIRPALLEYKNTDLLSFFEEKSLYFFVDDNGKVFPESEKAEDILYVLLKECRRLNISIKYREPVNNVNIIENTFEVTTSDSLYRSGSLIIATGGKSYPTTGSTGDGYTFAQKLGHHIIEPAPALTPVKILDYPFRELEGISIHDSIITIYRGGKKVKDRTGDIVFTRGGLSGPGILDLSRYIHPDDTLKFTLMNNENLIDFRQNFEQQIRENGKTKLKNILDDYSIPERLLKKVFETASISWDIKAAELKRESRIKLIEFLTAFPLTIDSLGGYNIAMVTRGGINLEEINPKTMESRIVKNLFFAGEILDIDGDTGGYNLQAAFSSGFLAGRSAGRKNG